MKIPAMRPARSPGSASALSVRNAPRNAIPKPTPATAVPDRKATADIAATAAKVTATPVSRIRHPASIAVGGARARHTTVAAAPIPASRKTVRPPHSRFGEASTCAASDGPSDRYRPARAHAACRHGTATAKVPRARGGTFTRGRSEASTPGRRAADSGITSIPAMAAQKAPSSSHHTR